MSIVSDNTSKGQIYNRGSYMKVSKIQDQTIYQMNFEFTFLSSCIQSYCQFFYLINTVEIWKRKQHLNL